MNMIAKKLATAIAAAVNAADHKGKAGTESKALATAVRDLAAAAVDDGVDSKTIAALFTGDAVKAKVKAGTIRPYAQALQGYMLALNEGTAITTGYGKGEKKDKPMPTKDAMTLYVRSVETDGEREEREAAERFNAKRDEIIARVRAITDVDVFAALREHFDANPESFPNGDAVKVESKAERDARELIEAANAARVALGLDDDGEEAGDMQQDVAEG